LLSFLLLISIIGEKIKKRKLRQKKSNWSRWSREIKEFTGLLLIGVGLIGGFFLGIRVWHLLNLTNVWLKIILSGLAQVISAVILIGAGFILITKKYNKLYYDRRLKGYAK